MLHTNQPNVPDQNNTEALTDSGSDVDSVSSSDDRTSPRRSSRVKRFPSRYGDPVNYDTSSSLPGENEVTQPWWPGYARGTWNHE